MTYGHFIWTDLSTYDMQAAKTDYAEFFGWSFHGDGAYDFAVQEEREIAAVFPMPAKLAEMNMPSFWMSYVHVEDVDQTVAKARRHNNVIIEIEPHEFSDNARIALVRDPSGAGFTVYEGEDITPPSGKPGQVTMRYHHLPDIKLIDTFYNDLFGWTFHKTADTPWPVYSIRHPDGSVIAKAEEVPETIRGKYRYWIPCFQVESLEKTSDKIKILKGGIATELSEGRVLASDQQGGHFMIQTNEKNGQQIY